MHLAFFINIICCWVLRSQQQIRPPQPLPSPTYCSYHSLDLRQGCCDIPTGSRVTERSKQLVCEELLKRPFLSPVRHPREHRGPHTPSWSQEPSGREVKVPTASHKTNIPLNGQRLKQILQALGAIDLYYKIWLHCGNVKAAMDNP